MELKSLVKAWVNAFNHGDIDKLVSLYSESAINHQVPEEPIEGRKHIREMFKREFSSINMKYIVENIFEDGEWAILEWRDPKDLRGCGFFHVSDGKIDFQRGYWDKLSLLRKHKMPIPDEVKND